MSENKRSDATVHIDSKVRLNGSTKVEVPLEDFIHDVVKDTVTSMLRQWRQEERLASCPVKKRLDSINLRLYILMAFLAGVGVLNIWTVLK